MSTAYDCIVIGAGPGGYVCAIRAAQLGKRVAIVEKRAADAKRGPQLGGTCLNVGCIPSKALLDSSEHFYHANTIFAEHGIDVGTPKLDVKAMMKRKDKVVRELTGGIGMLMKKNKVDVLAGTGRLKPGGGAVIVSDAEGDTTEYQAQDIVLAMGSVPIELPFLPFDGDRVVSSDQAIAFDQVPERLVVVGGGVIGLELGQVWARLGAQVTVVEFLDRIVPGLDVEAAGQLQKSLKKLGIDFHLGTKVTGATSTKKGIRVQAEQDGKEVGFDADKVLVAVGRRPLHEQAGLEEAGVTLTERQRVQVNEQLQTSVPHVWAIGDLIDGPMLAHKAEEDGMAVAETISGLKGHIDYRLVPGVVYTHPELAGVGITEEQAKDEGRAVKIGRFNFIANGRAKASGDVGGFVKVIADTETDELLGVTILGPRASDLIAEAVTVMAFGGSSEDIALICHAHPTFSEAVKEAALDAQGRVIHS